MSDSDGNLEVVVEIFRYVILSKTFAVKQYYSAWLVAEEY